MLIVLTFSVTATTRPTHSNTHCVERRYHPDARSIALSYQVSMFLIALSRSPCAESIAVRSTRCTSGLPSLSMFARTASSESTADPLELVAVPVFGPRAARSRSAIAKFLDGMYEGRLLPDVNALGRASVVADAV